MYQNKLAVAIKHNGKILREHGDLVKLPFGSEYTVLVKNLDSRRVKFRLRIDGDDALGDDIVVNGNAETEIKRFMRNGNKKEGNAFKFIERTQKIEDGPRGIKMEDGIISVEFWFEQRKPEYTTTYHTDVYYKDYYRPYPWWQTTTWSSGPMYSSKGITGSVARSIDSVKLGSANSSDNYVQTASATATVADGSLNVGSNSATSESVFLNNVSNTVNDVGITVAGSKVEQEFVPVYGFNAESQSHTIIIRLVGKVGEAEVQTPVTVKTKQKCTTCGHVNKANAKFCSDCGTALELL